MMALFILLQISSFSFILNCQISKITFSKVLFDDYLVFYYLIFAVTNNCVLLPKIAQAHIKISIPLMLVRISFNRYDDRVKATGTD